jgi:hypothetical protein
VRPEKLTDEGRAYLRNIAVQKSKIPPAKVIAAELHLSTSYVRQLLSSIARELSNERSVSRGAKD